MQWQRIAKPEFSYAIHIPQGWDERPPDLTNSNLETARFVDPTDRRHIVIVFRNFPSSDATPRLAAARIQNTLAAKGFVDFEIADAEVAGQQGARLDCAKHDAGRTWVVRQYIVVQDTNHFVLGCGSSIPDEDEALFSDVAERFEILV